MSLGVQSTPDGFPCHIVEDGQRLSWKDSREIHPVVGPGNVEECTMAKLTAKQFQEKHARRTKGALEDMRAGVNAVTEAPGAKAAEKADKMLAKITEAVQSGKWADRVAGVPLSVWKDKMLNKGVGRVPAGIDAAAADIEKFAGELLSHQDGYLGRLRDMPDLTLEDNISRAVENIRQMSNFKRS